MSRTRDRHGRGMRGPLGGVNPITGAPIPLRARQRKAEFFISCVEDAVDRIEHDCPEAVHNVEIGIEEVPNFEPQWADDRALLAAAMEPTSTNPAQVVVYRRPLERRCEHRHDLRRLVYRTLVEQLSAVTGISIDTIDPRGLSDGDQDD